MTESASQVELSPQTEPLAGHGLGISAPARVDRVDPVPRPEPGAALFVWAAWAVMLLAALDFSRQYGLHSIPFGDEWGDVILRVTGDERPTVAWLWEPHELHRMPMAKFIWLSLLKLSNYHPIVGLILNGLLMGALAGALILTARTLRGWTSYTDAFFPLALLHWGHWLHFIWCWQINEILPQLFVCALLIIIVTRGTRLTPGAIALAGICLLALPLNGATAVPYTLPLALWLVCCGVVYWRSQASYRGGVSFMAWGLAAAAVLLLGLHLSGLERPGGFPPNPTLRTALRGSVQFLCASFGPAVQPFWRYVGLAVLGLLVLSGVHLVVLGYRLPRECCRALGLVLFLGGATSLALAVGWGRSRFGTDTCLDSHYALIAMPALCGVYFIWAIGNRPVLSRLVQMSLFALTCALLPQNMSNGASTGNCFWQAARAFEQELRAGVPVSILYERYWEVLSPGADTDIDRGGGKRYMRLLHRAGIGPFQFLRDDPIFQIIPIPVKPAVGGRPWDKSDNGRFGDNLYLTFDLKEPRFVYAIRLKYSYGEVQGAEGSSFRVFWRRSDRNDFSKTERSASLAVKATPGEREVTVWVNDVIDQCRIQPHNGPCIFKVTQLDLLLPAKEGTIPVDP